MANFDDNNSVNIMDKIISKTEELDISALWYVSPFSQPSNLKNLLNEYGFHYIKDWTGMAIKLNSVNDNFEIPKGMVIRKVSDIHELASWTDVLTKSFDIQGTRSEMYKKYFLNLGMGNNLNFQYYLGLLEETPVASAILFKGKETAGIYYVGTPPEVRSRGIAKAMINSLLTDAKTEGYKISVLHASEKGYPLYKNIGFKKYYNINIYKKSNF
jgi:GNAT superfamily N-acetyltransferase